MGRDLLGSISELAEQLNQSRAALLQAMARARDVRRYIQYDPEPPV